MNKDIYICNDCGLEISDEWCIWCESYNTEEKSTDNEDYTNLECVPFKKCGTAMEIIEKYNKKEEEKQ